MAVSYPQHSGYTAFFQFSPDIQPVSPAFLLAGFLAKAFCRLFLWNFKGKSISPFLWPSFFYCLSGCWRHGQEVSCGYVRGVFAFGLPVSAKIFRGIPQKGKHTGMGFVCAGGLHYKSSASSASREKAVTNHSKSASCMGPIAQ